MIYALGVIAIGAVLGTGVADRLDGAHNAASAPTAAAVAPEPPPPGTVALQSDARGHFLADVQANGRFIKVLVDTGASVVALTEHDARAMGVEPARSKFTLPMRTANGVVNGAPVRINELRVGSILVRDVEAVVLPERALSGTLLGMSFLRRLSSFEMRGQALVLKQ